MDITVLRLDAADYEPANNWSCENILLDRHGEVQTETYSLNVPATLEVCPSIATGLPLEYLGYI